MARELEEVRGQAQGMREALARAQEVEKTTAQKLQSFQKINRSQNALMRAELQKCRRRLVHTSAVAARLKDQASWYQANSPGLSLPLDLQGLPPEEKDADEEADLAKVKERWELDIAQLQAELLNGAGVSPAAHAGTSRQPSPDSEAEQTRASDLEDALRRCKKELDRKAKELEELRARPAQAGAAPAQASGPPANAAEDGNSALLKTDLESAQKDAKEKEKKLKQLANAYKQLDQSKKDLEAQLKTVEASLAEAKAEAARPKAPQRSPISPELVGRIRSQLAAERTKIAELRGVVAADMQRQIQSSLQEAMASQMPALQKMMDAGIEEWKEKFRVECDKRRKLHNLVQELRGNIRVYARVRPLNEREPASCITFPSPDEVQIRNEALALKKTWQFNEVFKEDTTQALVFEGIRDLITSMLDGFNVCIFAYGQTGSGKTHSMQGRPDDPGIYKRTFEQLFKVARERPEAKIELKGSIIEIYNEEIRDLLVGDEGGKKPKLAVRQGKEGNHVPGLTMQPVQNTEEVERLLDIGQRNRSVARTDMNAHSSRSHLLVQIHGFAVRSDGKQISSAITLVDLAGSERLAKSGVTGDRAKEAVAINKSLSALGDVINSRASKSSHTPYRNSTLTHLLQDSLSGDSKTLMLLQLNPCSDYVEETMCSLQFGARVNNVEMSTDNKKK